MANIKVIITDQAGTQWDVSYIQEIPMSLNFAIADLRSPDKRNSTFSKTIEFPATNEINRLFRSIWQMNISLLDFDPNLKMGINYYIDNVEQLNGDLQLLKINVDGDGAPLTYETSAVGRLGNLFTAIGDKYLTDLDFSAYNHILSKANVKASWIAAIGSGYVYPLIDYGLNNINTETEYHVKYLRPALYKKEILDKIFASAGKTYTSTYFNSTYFKRQIVPGTSQFFNLSTSDADNSQFFARRNANQTGTANNCLLLTTWKLISGTEIKDVVIFNDDTSGPYYDPANIYNTATGVYTVANTNSYSLTTIINYEFDIANTSGTAVSINFAAGSVQISIEKFNGTSWVSVATNSVFFAGAYASLVFSGQLSVVIPANTFTTGDTYRVSMNPYNLSFSLLDAGSSTVTTGTTTATVKAKLDSQYYVNLTSTVITEGYTVEVNQAIPTNIKQAEWLMAEFNAANLYMEVDKNNSNNYIIEPREADTISGSPGFYTGLVDWSDKLDISLPHEVYPMGDLDFKRKEYTYKQDSDEFNTKYFKEYAETFGFKFLDITNDFTKPTIKTELVYSNTPIVGNDLNGLIVPVIRTNDNGVYTSLKANIRSLYYGGVINLSFGTWTLKSSSGDEVLSNYPFAGDCDNPYAPTFTLNWNTPHNIFYNYQLATYTDNNLYNRFYSRQNNQTTDKNSKIVKAYFDLRNFDIEAFDFRNVVYAGKPLDSYFYVNSIPNYDVLNPKSTMVELLKLADYDGFSPVAIEAPPQMNTNMNRIINGNYSNGTNNTNHGSNSHITGGSGNFIAAGAENIQLRNCANVVVNPDVTNFVGDGISNRVITSNESNTVSKQNSPSVTITSNTTIDASYNGKTVFIDDSLGAITITSDTANMTDCEIVFIKTSGTGTATNFTDIDATVTISGHATPYAVIPGQYDKIRLFYKTNIFIL